MCFSKELCRRCWLGEYLSQTVRHAWCDPFIFINRGKISGSCADIRWVLFTNTCLLTIGLVPKQCWLHTQSQNRGNSRLWLAKRLSRTITVICIVSRLQRRVKSVRPGECDWPRRAWFTSYNYGCATRTFKLLKQKQNDNPELLKWGIEAIWARAVIDSTLAWLLSYQLLFLQHSS